MVVPAALATGPGIHLLSAVIDAVPGLGVLRDGQKWVALAVPGYTLAGAGAVLTLRQWLRPAVTALVCCLALLLALPDLAWGAYGKVRRSAVPARLGRGGRRDQRPAREPGAVAVLPAGTMRRFSWSGPARRCSIRCPAGCAPTC